MKQELEQYGTIDTINQLITNAGRKGQEEEIAALKKIIEALVSEKNDLITKNEILAIEKQNLNKENKSLEATIRTLKNYLEQLTEGHKNLLAANNNALSKNIEEINNLHIRVEKQIADIKALFAKQQEDQAQIASLKLEIETLESKVQKQYQDKITELEREGKALNKRIEDLIQNTLDNSICYVDSDGETVCDFTNNSSSNTSNKASDDENSKDKEIILNFNNSELNKLLSDAVSHLKAKLLNTKEGEATFKEEQRIMNDVVNKGSTALAQFEQELKNILLRTIPELVILKRKDLTLSWNIA